MTCVSNKQNTHSLLRQPIIDRSVHSFSPPALPHWLWPFPGQLQAQAWNQQGTRAFHPDLWLCPRDPARTDQQQREVWEVKRHWHWLFPAIPACVFANVRTVEPGSGSTASGPIRSSAVTGRCLSTSLLWWRQQDCQSSHPSRTSSI